MILFFVITILFNNRSGSHGEHLYLWLTQMTISNRLQFVILYFECMIFAFVMAILFFNRSGRHHVGLNGLFQIPTPAQMFVSFDFAFEFYLFCGMLILVLQLQWIWPPYISYPSVPNPNPNQPVTTKFVFLFFLFITDDYRILIFNLIFDLQVIDYRCIFDAIYCL